MAFPLLLLGAGAAGAAVVAKSSTPLQDTPIASTTAALQARPTFGNGLHAGATIGQLMSGLKPAPAAPPPKAAPIAAAHLHALGGGIVKLVQTTTPAQQYSQGDAATNQKLDALNNYLSQTFDKLGDEAKQKGADYLNQYFHFDPPITSKSSYKDISAAIGGAVGNAGGEAIGNYFGGPIGGAIGAKLGAICGAYLGVKLEEFISKDMDQIGDWFKSRWNDIEDWVSDEVGSAASSVGNYLGSLF